MQRFFDITACLFSPPTDPDTEVQLYWNEKLEHSSGDIEAGNKLKDKKSQNPNQTPTHETDHQTPVYTPISELMDDSMSFTSIVHRKGIISKEKNTRISDKKSNPEHNTSEHTDQRPQFAGQDRHSKRPRFGFALHIHPEIAARGCRLHVDILPRKRRRHVHVVEDSSVSRSNVQSIIS